jgi:hypothetical protein
MGSHFFEKKVIATMFKKTNRDYNQHKNSNREKNPADSKKNSQSHL